MSHITGTVQVLATPLVITPGATVVFNPPAAPGGTKFLLLHFQNFNLLPGDQLRVNLGYATDTFTAADGPALWTRPINVYAFPAGVEITYVAAGATTGNVQLDRYGRGERHVGEPGHPSISNSDPFYIDATYLEPTYDPFWYCANPPNWENAARVSDPSDVRARVARSVGMIVSVEGDHVSTCSVTLVDADKVISAGHCHTPDEALTSSVVFDYQTLADASRPAGYNPRFYKVKAVLGHANLGSNLDFSLLQLAEAPSGLPVVQMRPDFPGVNETVFGVHHPNGAVKKLSIPHASGFSQVTISNANGIAVPSNFHVSGGSSGSGLFDTAGRIVGVLSRGAPCTGSPLLYSPTKNILAALVPTPPPALTRDVMVVIDRSGSMSMSDGAGRSKIETARDAVSLFVQLIRAGTGNRLGLVSFSTSASSPVDANLSPATAGSKTVLVGNAPYSTGLVGGLNPNGMTSIGDGLQAARNQLAAGGTNPRAILLMTDGLQNTAPMIADIDASLAGITVHAVGFGTESSLDGALLTSLTNAHGGQYQRAGNGLTLEKFFSSAFGNIFETGILFDPDFHLAADQPGEPIPFSICGEEALTVVIGWDNPDARLLLEVTTPNGVVIFGSTPSVEEDAGKTWHFLRIPLPLAGERDGPWSVRAVRPGGGGEFPPPAPATTYFINVIPSGGPKLTRMDDPKRYYTGDPINPLVNLRYEDGGWPKTSTLRLNVSRPDASIGTLLSRNGLGAADAINADGLDARQATLQAIERSTGRPVVRYIESSFNLSDESDATDGVFEPSGTFGTPLPGLFNVEGNYTFHAKASYGESCLGMRELIWSTHVEIGIDPGQTTVTSTPLGTGSGGETCQRLTFTPRDVFGNLLGPGRLDAFTAQGTTNTTLNGPVSDLGNGQYQVDACTNPESLEPPSIDLTQPGRPGVTISEPRKLFIYSLKFVCGIQLADCHCPPVQPGRYASEINILNPSENPVPMLIRPIPLVLAGAASGRDPKANGPGNKSVSKLPAHGATMIDCCRALELLLGAEPNGPTALTIGLFEVISTSELIVTAVYTASHGDSAPAIDVQQIAAKPFKV
jgi:hypothetical protein